MDQMRVDFENILKSYGHDILLQRRIQDSDLDEPEYQPTLERHTVRHMLPATRALPAVTQERITGLVHTSERVYYFKHDAYPYSGDRIYEYDEAATRVVRETWTIDEVTPMRGHGGKIVYWIAGVTQERPN